MRTLIIVIAIASGAVACKTPTSFSGEAKIPRGPIGCQAICGEWSMQMAGMVAMGEYSNACVCVVPEAAPSSAELVGAVGPAVVGVVEQMRRDAADDSGIDASGQRQPTPAGPPSPSGP
jgi:hypothetical protein